MATQQMKIDLTAKDKTGNAFRSLNARLEKTRKVAKSVVGAVLKLGAAGVALGGGFVVATKKALEFADKIGKTADKLGLSTDALQKYRYAADLAGVSNASLDKAFDKLVKSIGETTTLGTGAAFDAFGQLGLQTDLMSKKLQGTEPVFLAVADAIAKVEDDSQKAAFAAAIFGRAGTQMVNVFKDGAAGVKAAADELVRYNGVIGEDTIRNSESAIDAITRLTTVLQTKLTQALASNAVLIADFGTQLLEKLPKIIDAFRRLAEFIGILDKPINIEIVGLSKEIVNLQKLLKKTEESGERLGGTNTAGAGVAALNKEIKAKEARIRELQAEKKAAVETATALKDKQTNQRGQEAGQKALLKTLAEEKAIAAAKKAAQKSADSALEKSNSDFFTDISAKLDHIKTTRADILKGAKETAAAAGLELQYYNASEAVKNRAIAIAEIENRLKAEGVTLNTVQREQLEAALDLTQQRQESLAAMGVQDELRIKAAEELKEVQRANNELVKTGLQSMQDGITGLIEGTQTWRQALGGVLKTVINIVAKMGETKSGGFSFGKLAAGLAGSFLGGGNPNAPTSGFTNSGQTIDFFHTGGKIGGRNGQMPGLRSDERMIVGQTGERVLSRGQTAQGGGGGVTVNQTINVSTGVQQTVRAEVMSLAPQIAAQAKAAVLDAKKRGGGFGAAFA